VCTFAFDIKMENLGNERLFTHGDGEGCPNRQTELDLANSVISTENDLPHSYFPCLDSRPGASKTWQGTEVPFKDISLLQMRCQHQNVDSVSVFQAAWALVLKCYLGDPHVSFAFDCIRDCDDPSKLDHLTSTISWGEARLDQCTTSLGLLRHVHTRNEWLPPHSAGGPVGYGPDSRRLGSPANTCLLYRKTNQEVWTGLEESTLQQYVDQGLNFKIIAYAEIGQDDIFIGLYYLNSVLSVVSAANVARAYSSAIEQLLAHEEQPLIHIDLFTERDLDQIRKWNQHLPLRVNSCVHEQILQHARSRPHSLAIDSWDGQLSYEEVDVLSFNLAQHFVRAGIRPECLVPVCFTKSLYVVISMLAVLRAGGAFIPLDPSYPQDRLRTIVQKAGANIVVTGPDTADRFVESGLTVITVSAKMLQALRVDAAIQLPQIKTYNAAFVLFTSGSTGQPKGIVQEHASVCTSAVRHGRAMNMTAESRVFQYAAFAFDVSMMDIFSTMICGGCICMPSERDRLGDFTPIMNKLQVNWVLFTPSVASLIQPEDVPSLKNLIFGGEAVKEENVTRWSGKVNLFNCYGPAECCACSIGKFEGESMRPSNIGRQFGGGLNWVVSPEDHDRLMPIGCVGELVVEGPTLARGYLGDVVKTKASFIKDPAWPGGVSGARRVYFTGDLVRQNSDGTFEFVGRKDHQLKIRGQRVELGEIEHHLAKYPRVAFSTVLRPLSGPYAQRLVAMIQLQQINRTAQKQGTRFDLLSKEELSAAPFDQTALASSLKSVLPVYMVPQHFIVVKNLPLSLSGKVDRRTVEAWLQSLTRLVELEAEAVNVNRNSNGFAPKEDHVTSEICNKVSSMVAPTDADFREFLERSNLLLASLALDSIQFIALTMFIRQRFGVNIELETLIHPQTTVGSIAKAVKTLKCCDVTQTAEPRRDAADFFQSHRMEALKRLARDKRRGQNVFLTGATGFLGSRILYTLCKDASVSKVFVHIRRHSSEQRSDHPLHRVIHSAHERGWWRAEYIGKLEAWTGDLAKPKLGLSPGHWSRLRGHGTIIERVSAIIHNGAIVNWNSSFDSLRAPNVDSTMDLLTAAAESPALEHFVFVSGGQQLKLEADNEMEIAEEVMKSNGYAQSKFLSELLVKDYACKAAPSKQQIAIVKPGYIIGSLEDDETPAGDYIWRLAATCAFNRAYNAADASSWLFVSEVDRVASAIVEACSFPATNRAEGCDAKIVKILDGIPVQDFWRLVGEELGCKIQALAPNAWMERIYRDVESRSEKHPLWPLLYTLEKGNGLIGTLVDHHSKIAFDRPRVSVALRKNIDHLKANGTLQTPEEDLASNGTVAEVTSLARGISKGEGNLG
ncbi:MAG: hypothetical protein Q9217_006262, partial [Psora testacea]